MIIEKEKWKKEHKHLTGPLWKKYFTWKSSLERKGLNYRIQGNAGGMMKLAMVFFRKWIIENNIDYCAITNIVHDEVLVECVKEDSKIQIVKQKIQECMEEAGKFFCKNVPMKAEAVVNDYWKH